LRPPPPAPIVIVMNAKLAENIRAIEKFVAEHDRRLAAAAPLPPQPKLESSQSDS
jgi:hypothetical protein